jgi:UDP-glucose-4-epimerase GalE
MNILVTGGAGYIGSHACKALKALGHNPIAYDNLIYGHRDSVKWGDLCEGDIGDSHFLGQCLDKYRVNAVMHFAAYAYVGESVTDPMKYYENNLGNTLTLLHCMLERGIRYFIFSSTCATYGNPVSVPIEETHPQIPINPYGKSKLMIEHILQDYDRAYGLRFMSLRYFNAAGADPECQTGEDHDPETHLIPIVLEVALGRRKSVHVFGTDYDTPDGSCVRDYVHVTDLARAHTSALDRLVNGAESDACNLGTGKGYSVLEVIEAASRVTSVKIQHTVTGRRPGDPAVLLASGSKARDMLDWVPDYTDIESIIATAWHWHKTHFQSRA